MEIDRQRFLKSLEMASPGLASKEIIEQTSCFVFRGNMCYTFNDEIACRVPIDIDVTCAVQATALLSILNKTQQERIDVSIDDSDNASQLVIKTKSSRTGVFIEQEILLGNDVVEEPASKDWVNLHQEFAEAVSMVSACASKDESRFDITCIHVSPKFVEACDMFQMARYSVKTGIKKPILVRAPALKAISQLGMTHIAQTASWLHFRNADGLQLSVRLYAEEYPNLDTFYVADGTKLVFPGGLSECIDKAAVFTAGNQEDESIQVVLKKDKIRIKGTGTHGWHEEIRKTKYSGPPMTFNVAPKLFLDFTTKSRECVVAPERIFVDGGNFKWLGCLEVV